LRLGLNKRRSRRSNNPIERKARGFPLHAQLTIEATPQQAAQPQISKIESNGKPEAFRKECGKAARRSRRLVPTTMRKRL